MTQATFCPQQWLSLPWKGGLRALRPRWTTLVGVGNGLRYLSTMGDKKSDVFLKKSRSE
jgi:hypothetical protein